MWSILYQCAGEKFPIVLVIELSLFALYSDEIVESFFSFMKLVKSDWCSKSGPELNHHELQIMISFQKFPVKTVTLLKDNSWYFSSVNTLLYISFFNHLN